MALLHLTDGTTLDGEQIIVKVNGFVKIKQDGSFSHFPPHRIDRIAEPSPDESTDLEGNKTGYYESSVVYQSPHGRV